MEHKLIFLSADDRTDPDPSKNYGVFDVCMKFLVYGPLGITEFDLHTNWYLPHVMDTRLVAMKRDVLFGKEDFLLKHWISPSPLDVCYWSLERISEYDTYFKNGCSYVFDHKPCYYGYSYSQHENGLYTPDFVYDKFLRHGDDVVWEYLEKYYSEIFG